MARIRHCGKDGGSHCNGLYRRCIAQYYEAIGQEFYIEAVAIIESLISDRLESRLACKHGNAVSKRRFSTVGKLATELKGKNSGEASEAREIYSEISLWSTSRNSVIHQLAKLEEGETPDWDARYREARRTTETGMALFRKLDRLVWNLNRPGDSI